MRAASYWVLAAALAMPSPLLAADDPFEGIPRIKFQYYDVEGRTPTEIYASLRARAPQKGDGVAHTAWHMRVGWQESRRGSECAVVDPMTSLSILVVLPRLITREVTPQGADFWRRTLRGLEIHEAGHARIAYDHRGDFSRTGEGASCRDIRAIAAKVQARVEKIQADYDRDTNHGIKQIPRAGENE
jgi:predicted secreted Zn-dependent protease